LESTSSTKKRDGFLYKCCPICPLLGDFSAEAAKTASSGWPESGKRKKAVTFAPCALDYWQLIKQLATALTVILLRLECCDEFVDPEGPLRSSFAKTTGEG